MADLVIEKVAVVLAEEIQAAVVDLVETVPIAQQCIEQLALNVVVLAKFRSNQLATNQYFVAIVLKEKMTRLHALQEEEMNVHLLVIVVAVLLEHVVAMIVLALKKSECLKQFVLNVAMRAKFHSNHLLVSQYIAVNALASLITEVTKAVNAQVALATTLNLRS